MKPRLTFFIVLYFLSTVLYGRVDTLSDSLDILTPRAQNPAFAEPHGTFVIELRMTNDLSSTGWKVYLGNDLRTWPCTVLEAKEDSILHGTESGWRLTVKVPGDISPELMRLELTHASGKSDMSARAVSIVPDFEQDFYIFHQSDQHLTADKAVEPGGKSSTKWGHGSKEALAWIAPIVNLTNPRFVIHTGDNIQVYNEPDHWCGMDEAKRRINRFMEGLSGYTVATPATTGNHDNGFSSYIGIDEWRKVYNDLMGQRAFSFRMGSFYVLASEWTDDTYLRWAKNDYAKAVADSTITYRLLASHYYNGLSGWTTIAGDDHPCDLLIVGHNHRTRTLQTEPYRVLSVATAQHYQRAAFFDFKRTATGWTSVQPASHADEVNVHRLVGDYGTPRVSATYDNANDGTTMTNTVHITNSLPHNFYDGRVRFLLQKGEYAVSGGQILAQYEYAENTKTAVLVKIDIPADSDIKTSIRKIK